MEQELKTINYFNTEEFLRNEITFRLYRQFKETGKPFFNKNFNGLIENFESFCAELERLTTFKKVVDISSEDDLTRIYSTDPRDSFESEPIHFISIYVPNDNKITMEMTTNDVELLEKVSEFCNSKFQELKKEKQIHMIAPDEYSEQTSLYPMGEVSCPLIRQNYSDDVLKKVDFVIKELNSENPIGRMVLVDGSPGTGKSFLIRGILNELNFGTCVLVPVSMLESLDKPTLIPLLLKNKRKSGSRLSKVISPKNIDSSSEKSKPIILIIEDADSVLVPRQSDNMSAISSLLNYTDGIFGSLFDLRIVATTNASRVEIEPALLRPGRLLKRIHVDTLSAKKAEEVYFNLTSEKRKFEKDISLASVYSLSKGAEIDEDAEEEHQTVVGF